MSARRKGRRARLSSMRVRLTVSLVAVAVLPMVAVVTILGNWTYDNIEREHVRLLEESAAGVAASVGSILQGAEEELLILDEVLALGSRSPAEQRAALQNLLASDPIYQELALVGADGVERVRLSRASVVLDSDLRSWDEDPTFATTLGTAIPAFGPVTFDKDLREPLTTLAAPLMDRRTGRVQSVVVASIRFKPIWDFLGAIAESGQSDVYVTTPAGSVIAHRNPAVVLSGTDVSLPPSSGRATGLFGEDAVVAMESLHVGGQVFAVVAEQPTSVALRVATRALQVTAGVTFSALAAALVLAGLAARFVVRPIEDLADSARRITTGDLTHRAAVTSASEIGDLAQAFNTMTAELSELIATLEERVQDRTSELEDANATQRELIAQLGSRNAELQQARRELEGLIESKDEFLASVSHELRTPLTSVVGFASELLERSSEFSAEERYALLDTISDQGQEMAHIIDDLLVAARARAGNLVVEPMEIDVRAAIEPVLKLWPNAGVRLSDPAAPVIAFADANRTRQIVRNLVGNSVRYGGPTIEVHLDQDDGDVVVQVRDDGAGIPADEWETVFDPYQTAHHGDSQPASVGLGLTVSRALARHMGGDLTYRREDYESVFELVLPGPGRSAPSATTGSR